VQLAGQIGDAESNFTLIFIDLNCHKIFKSVWVVDFGYWKPDFGYWIQDAGNRILDTGYWMLVSGFWFLD
jgi:hypothetical protein